MVLRSTDAKLRDAAREIVRRGGAAALTGAGISVESGIPDFRSARGIWERYDPFEYATIEAFLADPRKVWGFLVELGELLGAARPNPAHTALARLEREGRLSGIATQNVDGLHQAAGSRRVLELHGSPTRLRCARCGLPSDEPHARVRAALKAGMPPVCHACGGPVKPDVVLFGETLPHEEMREAEGLVRAAPVLLVVGTSATVWPVAGLPEEARRAGAHIVEVNLAPTELTGDVAHATLLGRAGEVLPALAEAAAEEARKG
jgi:NAD-dependent deacetylase